MGVEKPAFPRLPFVTFALFVLQLLDRQAVASVLKRVSPRILADGDRPPMRPGMSSLGRVSSLACFSDGAFQMFAIFLVVLVTARSCVTRPGDDGLGGSW